VTSAAFVVSRPYIFGESKGIGGTPDGEIASCSSMSSSSWSPSSSLRRQNQLTA
jgi:hypothetical protein